MRTNHLHEAITCIGLFATLVVGSLLNAQTVLGTTPVLPSWLADKRELLPNVTEEQLTQMAQAWPSLQVSDVVPAKMPDAYWNALKTVVDLNENAALAIVWFYAQDTPRFGPLADTRKSVWLNLLSKDSTSHRWVLPILRYRLKWISGLLERGEHEQISQLSDELSSIHSYMNIQGEENEAQDVQNLIARLAASNQVINTQLASLLEPQYDANARASAKYVRTTYRKHLYRYHEWAKLTLACRDHSIEDAAKLLDGEIDSLRLATPVAENPVSSQPPTSKKTSEPVPNSKPNSSTRWSVIAVLIVAATGLLWLLVKKRK